MVAPPVVSAPVGNGCQPPGGHPTRRPTGADSLGEHPFRVAAIAAISPRHPV